MATPHIRKRQFQPSLDSYFTRNANSSQSRRTSSPMSPPLPAETQANLFTVGMRVRKSVPEGYKTHKTIGSGYPFPSSAPPAPPSSAPARSSLTPSHARELTPFCGLHKIGGLVSQKMPPSSAPVFSRRHFDEDDEGVPELAASQATAISMHVGSISGAAQAINRKKRTYEDEAEDELDAYFDEMDAEGPVTPQPDSVRPVARMKSLTLRKPGLPIEVRVVDGEDFDEAPFLAPMDVDR